MDYIIANATEIMQLCFGGGFLILALLASRALWITISLLKKINDVTDVIIEYLQKPISMIISAEKTISKVLSFLQK